MELSLTGFPKVPFTCSYLPGKSSNSILGFLFLSLIFAILNADLELCALHEPLRLLSIMSLLAGVGLGLWAFNHHGSKSAVLYCEQLQNRSLRRSDSA